MRRLTWQAEQKIRADYLLRTTDGYVYSLAEVASRHGVAVSTVSQLAKRRGISRYTTTGRSAGTPQRKAS